jgi:hypothetical protein
LAHGITYLKPKDSDTKNPSKYRPITCPPTIYKIMTSCIKVIIDTVIMEQARKNNRNIYTAFIDYKKATQ